MRGIGLMIVAALSAVTLVSCASTVAPITAPAAPGTLRVATHNVHYINLEAETGAWSRGDFETRKVAMDQAFKALDADIVAFQEMESFARSSESPVNLARDWLLAQNPAYAAGANGDSKVFPSTQPILYRKDRMRLADQGWFFFSDTPDVIYSRTFNGSFPAFASWAQFDLGGQMLRVVNVHNDFASMRNRVQSSALIAARIKPWIDAGERVMVVGDFNALRGGQPLDIVAEAGIEFVPVKGATFHLNRGWALFGAIDHMGVGPGVRLVGDTQVLRDSYDGVYPSDHYPVVGDFVVE